MNFEKKVVKLLFSLTIFFQISVGVFYCFYSDEIYFNPNVKPISYEFWSYLVNNPDVINNELVKIVSFFCFLGVVIFGLGLLFVCTTTIFKKTVGIKIFITLGAFFLAIYIIIQFYIRTFVSEYKLFMEFIPSELLSLFLMIISIVILIRYKHINTSI